MAASAALAGPNAQPLRSLSAGLVFTVLAMSGFTFNDIADYRKDRAAGVRRPIATGELSRLRAAWLGVALLALAGLLSAAAGVSNFLFAVTAVALLLYSPISLLFPFCKDIYVALLCCAPLAYGARVGGGRYTWYSYATLVCFVLGREVLMDADELEGDKKGGIRTIAAILGERRTALLGEASMTASLAGLIVIARHPFARIVATATLLFILWLFTSRLPSGGRIQMSRFAMLAAAVALAWSGV